MRNIGWTRRSEVKAPLFIEVDNENNKKDITQLDIEIPVLAPRIYREYKNISALNPSAFMHTKIKIRQFSEKEKRQIVFRDIASGEVTHRTELDGNFIPNYQSVIGYFAYQIRRDLRLIGGHDVLYKKVKDFIINHLFEQRVDLENLNSLRNLAELEATRTVIETFKNKINELTIVDKGDAEIQNYIKISKMRPFVTKDQEFILPKKSAFNKIVGDSHFELLFADFLENCDDVVSYAKNYLAVHFKIDYKNADGQISHYYPDFFVKVSAKEIYITETKGQETLDDLEKIKRLYQWCDDINAVQKKIKFSALYVKQEEFEKYRPRDFSELAKVFRSKKINF